MKRLIKHSIVAALALALPSGLLASDGSSEDSTEETTLVTNQSTVNTVVVDQLKTTSIEQSISQQESQTSTSAQPKTKTFSGYAGAQYIYSDKIQIFNIPLGMQVGYGFGVEANVPVVFVDKDVSASGKSESGIGDISAGINYHFGTPASNGLSIVTVLYKSTTGDEKKSLGSGADAYTLSYNYTKLFNGKYTLHLIGSYTLNSDYTNQWNTKIDYGDSYMAVIGGSMPCLLSDKVTTSAKLTYFHADKTKDTYQNGNSWEYGETDVTDLWIQWDSTQLLSGIPLGLGVKIPLQNEVKNSWGTKNPDKKFSFYLSVSGLF